ncbi:MAG TPA: hypothetical protein VLH38_05220 [Patescibacteria group bacterium]|nr:hypothetical protein [Patescibacteria group bacterium]
MGSVSFSPKRVLRWFGFKQTLRGAIIIGVISGFMLTAQGLAYEKSYPDAVSQAKFASSLESVPALGFMYGEAKNLSAGTDGYMVYRVGSIMALITSVWGIMAITRLLRGNEEDGRWEPIRMGAVTTRAATGQVIAGFIFSWLVGYLVSTLITGGVVALSDLSMSFSKTLFVNAVIFLPGLLFAMVGAFTSQLALTRQRAILFGVIPLFGFFLLRGAANINTDLHWLMALTPFGWANLVNPILDLQPWWLLLFALFGAIFVSLGLWFAERDLGSSIIAQSDTVRSRYFLLGGSWQLGLRQNMWVFAAWAFGSFAIMAMITGLSSIAVKATADSKNLSNSIGALAGNSNDLRVAFVGVGLVFLVMILMIMATTIIGGIRNDESRQFLDTILVQPVRRTSWLISRLLLGFSTVLCISIIAGSLVYVIALGQQTHLNFGTVMATSICLTGTIAFLLGLGVLIYGMRPRISGVVMYLALGWSFTITLLSSAITLNHRLLQSSLFHYASFNLTSQPDWRTFGSMLALGLIMAALGVTAFAKRDTVIA